MEFALPSLGLLAFFLLITLVIVSIVVQVALRQRAASSWETFARERNLVYSTGGVFGEDTMHGNLDGLRFTINTLTRTAGRSRTVFTQWHVEIPAWMPQGMQLTRETLAAGLHRLFGAEDIVIGDAQLDGAFMIEGNDAVAIRNLLTHPQVRPVMLQFASSFGRFNLGTTVRIEESGRVADPRVLDATLRHAVHLARTLASAASQQGVAPQAPPPQLPERMQVPVSEAPAFAAVHVHERSAPVAGYDSGGGAAFRESPRPVYDLPPLPPALALLAKPELPAEDQLRVAEQARGCWHVLEMVVQRVEPTASQHVPQDWAGGCTVVGVAAEGLAVAVSFPRSHAAHLAGVRPGASIRVQAGLISWECTERLLRLGAV